MNQPDPNRNKRRSFNEMLNSFEEEGAETPVAVAKPSAVENPPERPAAVGSPPERPGAVNPPARPASVANPPERPAAVGSPPARPASSAYPPMAPPTPAGPPTQEEPVRPGLERKTLPAGKGPPSGKHVALNPLKKSKSTSSPVGPIVITVVLLLAGALAFWLGANSGGGSDLPSAGVTDESVGLTISEEPAGSESPQASATSAEPTPDTTSSAAATDPSPAATPSAVATDPSPAATSSAAATDPSPVATSSAAAMDPSPVATSSAAATPTPAATVAAATPAPTPSATATTPKPSATTAAATPKPKPSATTAAATPKPKPSATTAAATPKPKPSATSAAGGAFTVNVKSNVKDSQILLYRGKERVTGNSSVKPTSGGTYTLKVTAPGYKPYVKEIKVTGSHNLSVYLKPEPQPVYQPSEPAYYDPGPSYYDPGPAYYPPSGGGSGGGGGYEIPSGGL